MYGYKRYSGYVGSYVMLPLPGMYPKPSTTSQSVDEKQTKPPSPTQIYPEEPLEDNKVNKMLSVRKHCRDFTF